MNIKSKLVEFVIKHDFIPTRTEGERCARGYGGLFSRFFNMIHESGYESVDEVVEMLKIERDLHGCAIVLVGINKVFGIKGHIARKKKVGHPKCALQLRHMWGVGESIDKDIKHKVSRHFCSNHQLE